MLFIDMINLFYQECKFKIIKAMEYRLEFFLSILISLIFSFSLPLFQFLIYSNTRGYPGWSFNEILLFQAILLLWMGVTDTIFGDLKPLVDATVQYGFLDRFLVYPYPPIAVILTKGFNYRSSGVLLAGIIAFIYALTRLHIVLSIHQIIFFFLSFVIGILLFVALLIFYCTLTIRLVYVFHLSEILNKIVLLGNIPAEVFSGTLKVIYLSVLPIAIWINYPARILLGRINGVMIFSAFSSVFLFILSLILWKHNLKKYVSAGS